jgi:hypothetical protein
MTRLTIVLCLLIALFGSIGTFGARARGQTSAPETGVGAATGADPAAAPAAEAEQEDERLKRATRECRERLKRIETRIAERRDRYSVMPPQDVRAMREAAIALVRAGDGEGCNVLANRVEQVMAERRQDWNEEQERRRITEAKPFWEVLPDLRASAVIGAEVLAGPEEEIGSVEDVIFSREAREYLLISHGGFLGIGEDLVPVPVEQIRVTADGHTLVLDVPSDKTMDNAPTLKELQKVERGEWAQNVDNWWAQALQQNPPQQNQPPQ